MSFQEAQRIVTNEERIKKEGYKFDLTDIMQDKKISLSHNNILENKMLKQFQKDEEKEKEELDDILLFIFNNFPNYFSII